MTTIYHNPRCSKSREGLDIVASSGEPYQVVRYLETPLSEGRLREILQRLNLKPIKLIRTNEAIWKEQYLGKKMSDDALITAMATHPKLIERPIVVKGDRAVVGRPPEKIREFLTA